MTLPTGEIWTIILLLGLGSFLLRFSFLGLIGDRKIPDWVLRHLRYTPVAVLPGLVAPLVIWPQATDGATDPARLIAAMTTMLVGYFSRNLILSVASGAGALYAGLHFLG